MGVRQFHKTHLTFDPELFLTQGWGQCLVEVPKGARPLIVELHDWCELWLVSLVTTQALVNYQGAPEPDTELREFVLANTFSHLPYDTEYTLISHVAKESAYHPKGVFVFEILAPNPG